MKNVLEVFAKKYRSFPQQVQVLVLLFAVFLFIFLFVRQLFIPESFGKYGNYRAAAVDSIMANSLVYAGHQACAECHDDVAEEKSQYMHRHVACETCHGPGYAHTREPDEHSVSTPKGRKFCVLCHSYNPSRPTGFPRIDPLVHNPLKQCTTCHEPHTPEPPSTPKECGACHADIARTKAISPHRSLKCTTCHKTKEEHKTMPRSFLSTIPTTSEFCGTCHSEDAGSDEQIPRVDLAVHGEGYFCGQCHYPHFPEVY